MRERFSSPFCKEAFTDYRQNPLLMLHLDQAITITLFGGLILLVELEFFGEMESRRKTVRKCERSWEDVVRYSVENRELVNLLITIYVSSRPLGSSCQVGKMEMS